MRSVRRPVLAAAALLTVVGALLLALPTAGAATPAARAATAVLAGPCVYVSACTPTLSVVSPLAAAGSTETLVGTGFLPGDTVTITLTFADGSTLVMTAVADAQGTFTVTFVVPDSLGPANAVAVGARSGSAGTTLTVVSGRVSGSGAPTAAAHGVDGAGGGNGGGSGSGNGNGSGNAAAGGGGLAFTGVAVAGTGALAVLLLVGGTTLVVLGRRRPLPGRSAPGTP